MKNLILNMFPKPTYFPDPALSNSWWKLRVESCALRERGLAHGTWANKVSHLRSYICFTTYYGVQDFPVKLTVLLRFIALLGRGNYAAKSATNIIGSLKFFASLLCPSESNVFDSVLVVATLKGLKAQLSRPVHQMLPISVAHLVKFYSALDLNLPSHLACWCAMLLAFFGCLRLSNLVPLSPQLFDPLKHLRRDDIRFAEGVVLLFYKWSKTNQHASKVSWIPICPVSDARFNVKVFLEKLCNSVNAPDNAPLFTFEKSVFHTRTSLVRLLSMCCLKAELPPADYSWHSFRRGAAVFAFELGLADSAVQLLGDWSSAAFKNYLEFSFSRKVNISDTISKKFDLCVKML